VSAVPDNQGDAELVRDVLAGRRDRYAILVDRHLASVFAAVNRIVGNRSDAEDLAQETFVRAFERLDQYGSDYPFRNWLLKIATNLAINHIRSRQRERARYPRIVERQQSSGGPPADMPAPGDWEHWLARLDESQRTAIVLFHFHDLSYEQVAENMGVPLNTVRTYLHRGRKRLRELMTARTMPESGSWTAAS